MPLRRQLFLPALVLALTTYSTAALAAPDASAPPVPAAPTAPTAASSKRDASAKGNDNDDLVRMGASLLDNGDLIRMGANLLEERVDAGADAGADAGRDAQDAEVDASDDAAALPDTGAKGVEGGSAPLDAAAPLESSPPPVGAPGADDGARPPRRGGTGGVSRADRIRSGANVDPQGPKDSPFAKLGVPPAAVPAVATAATAGVMAFWPFLIKTLTGLLKGVIGGLLKNRAKKGQKVDATQRAFTLAGFVIRPMELTSLLIAALVYGLAVCYTLQGWKMALPFVRTQELLVVVIYFSRSVVRFIYERTFKLTTQYKFWVGGGLLCLGSAYLGNTLGTVGYELESSKGPEDAARIVKMKTWLLVLALAMAVGFCIANRMAPAKILQSGRVMMSGMALGEIMPIAPMPGKKIYDWRKDIWALLFVIVVPAFFIMNLFL
jgi:hypothetical protein